MEGQCELLDWPRALPFEATAIAAATEGIVAEAAQLYQQRDIWSLHLRDRAERFKRDSFRNAQIVRDLINLHHTEVSAAP